MGNDMEREVCHHAYPNMTNSTQRKCFKCGIKECEAIGDAMVAAFDKLKDRTPSDAPQGGDVGELLNAFEEAVTKLANQRSYMEEHPESNGDHHVLRNLKSIVHQARADLLAAYQPTPSDAVTAPDVFEHQCLQVGLSEDEAVDAIIRRLIKNTYEYDEHKDAVEWLLVYKSIDEEFGRILAVAYQGLRAAEGGK